MQPLLDDYHFVRHIGMNIRGNRCSKPYNEVYQLSTTERCTFSPQVSSASPYIFCALYISKIRLSIFNIWIFFSVYYKFSINYFCISRYCNFIIMFVNAEIQMNDSKRDCAIHFNKNRLNAIICCVIFTFNHGENIFYI